MVNTNNKFQVTRGWGNFKETFFSILYCQILSLFSFKISILLYIMSLEIIPGHSASEALNKW